MCGIVGYIGKREALPILMEGIGNLEYRGYDSSGFAILNGNGIESEKAVGKVAMLTDRIKGKKIQGTLGIIHSRWATHGGVTEANAHPHSDCAGNIWLVHNGIIENYKELKDELVKKGHAFSSETDTETIAHLIEEEMRPGASRTMHPGRSFASKGTGRTTTVVSERPVGTETSGVPFQEAVRLALRKLRGTYGLVIVNANDPATLIAARNFSPLLVGIGDGEYIVASDAAAVVKHTKEVIYLGDGEMAVFTPESHTVYDLKKNIIEKEPDEIEWSLEEAQKGGYEHFMLKEIFEIPDAVENAIRGRLIPEQGLVKLGGLESVADRIKKIHRIIIAACGTARFAGLFGEYAIEEFAGVPVEVEYGSELRYRQPVFEPGTAVIVISQSGETADTLAAVLEAKKHNMLTLGVVNVVGSTIAREMDAGVYTHAGPEIAVASTKALSAQMATMVLFTLFLGRQRTMSAEQGKEIATALTKIPDLQRKILEQNDAIAALAKKYKDFNNFFFLGRKYNYPIALEGDLKLKEVSYIHSEAYAAGEMKHGPIAMIDESFPSFFIAPQDSVYEKVVSNIQEIRARKGPVIAIATEGDERIKEIADDVIYIPKTLEMLNPLLAVIPLQLFAYHFGILRGYDVDKPRNLAKSVTVE